MPPQDPPQPDGLYDDHLQDEADENDKMNAGIGISTAPLLINAEVLEDRSLDEVHKALLGTDVVEQLHPSDVAIVDQIYVNELLQVGLAKAKRHIDALFASSSVDEIAKRLEQCDELNSIDELADFFNGKQFARNLGNSVKLMTERQRIDFVGAVRATFERQFLDATQLRGELGVYRSLLVCNKKTQRSRTFCDAVQKLWRHCINETDIVDIVAESDNVCLEHNLFASLVEEFSDEFDKRFMELASPRRQLFEYSFIADRIAEMFTPLCYSVFLEEGSWILEVKGRNVTLSAVLDQVEQRLEQQENIDEVRFVAEQRLIVNSDITWEGKNLSVVTKTMLVERHSTWNLSGLDAPIRQPDDEKAGSGKRTSEDGQDGSDGVAGGSSGRLLIAAECVENAAQLHVVLNGGRGQRGQDGGDGADGKEGIGETFSTKFSTGFKALAFTGSLGNTLFGGLVYRAMADYSKEFLSSGIQKIFSISAYRTSTHWLKYYGGTAGQAGGKGGLNGNGGDGGKAGTCTLLNRVDGAKFAIDVSAKQGTTGEAGTSGKTGLYGIDGWDIGVIRKTGESWQDFGENHNQKLDVEHYSDYRSDTIYVPSMYNGEGSKCYVGFKRRERTRKALQDNEKFRETKAESSRRGEAIAKQTKTISVKAIEKKYLSSEAAVQLDEEQEVEASDETSAEISRLAVHIDFPKVKPYVEKRATALPSADSIEAVITVLCEKPSELDHWHALMGIPVEANRLHEMRPFLKHLKVDEAEEIKKRFTRKLLIAELRKKAPKKMQFANIIRRYILTEREKKSDILAMVAIAKKARMVRSVELRDTDCWHYLRALSEEPFGFSACTDALLGLENTENTLRDVAKAAFNRRMSAKDFVNAVALVGQWSKLQIRLKSLAEHREHIEDIFNSIRTGIPLQNGKEALEQLCKAASADETKALTEAAAALSTLPFSVDTVKEIESAWKNPVVKLLYAFNRLSQLIAVNKLIAVVLKSTCQLLMSEEVLIRDKHIYGEHVSPATWLRIADDNDLRDKCLETTLKYGVKTAAGRALLAWETRTNLRVYCGQRLIENHLPGARSIIHVDLDSTTAKFTVMIFDMTCVEMQCQREHVAEQFGARLRDLQEGDKLFAPELEVVIKEICKCCGEKSERSLDQNSLGYTQRCINDIIAHMADATHSRQTMELLCAELPKVGDRLLQAMLHVFDSEGAFISGEELDFMLNTVFETSVANKHRTWHANWYAHRLLVTPQDGWLDAFIVDSVETAMRRRLARDAEFRHRLAKLNDVRLKILFAQKLRETPLEESKLLEILRFIQKTYGAFVELRAVALENWQTVIEESYVFYLLQGKPCSLPDEQRQSALFWATKLSEVYGQNEAEAVYELLAKRKSLGTNDAPLKCKLRNKNDFEFPFELFSIIVQRLCNQEVAFGKRLPTPSAIICKLLSCLIDESVSDDQEGGGKDNDDDGDDDDDEIEMSCAIFGTSVDSLRKAEKEHNDLPKRDFMVLLEIMMKNDDSDGEFIEAAKLLKEASKEDINNYKPLDEIAENLCWHPLESPTQFEKRFPDAFDNVDRDLVLLHIVDAVIKKKRDFCLRDNQKLAVMCALKSSGNLLEEVATGEGKSLIVATLSIIKVLCGHSVNIVTSSATLASRDTESPAPKGCADIYKVFGIRAAHICVEDSSKRRDVYGSCQIVYGDLTSFQRDYLLDAFYSMNIVSGHRFDTVIVDEVDSMLLDQGNNMLYLSHTVADLEMLQQLFVRIWQQVCAAVDSDGHLPFVDDELVRQIAATVFPMIELDSLATLLCIDENVAARMRKELRVHKIVDGQGEVLIEATEISTAINKMNGLSGSEKHRLEFMLRNVLAQTRLDIPRHLHSYVKRHLQHFIANAKVAMFMEEGEGYQVDVVRSETCIQFQPKVIIVDQCTGVDLPTTQWHNGLHQFLQLKHGCRLSPVSLKAVFVSNVSFLNKFKNLYGFSGTLGAVAERRQLSELYQVRCLSIPSSCPKWFYEKYSKIAHSYDSWVDEIFAELQSTMSDGRSALVICQSVKQVIQLHAAMRAMTAANIDASSKLRDSFKTMQVYKRDYEEFAYGDGNAELECGKIIFSTNLAGRGTDIKLCKDLIRNGGLHVIVTFLPDNVRIEEQAFGRAARCGQPGSARLILLNDDTTHANISRMKIHRNAQEVKRIQAITTFYTENIKVEEDCFEQFAKKFGDLLNALQGEEENMRNLLLKDLLDAWADWLDGVPKDVSADERVVKARDYAQSLTVFKRKPTRPLNRLQYGVLNALANQFAEAATDFDYVISHYPDFCAEAQYYKAFTVIKQNSISGHNDAAYKEAKQLFENAKRVFRRRQNSCYNDRAVIEVYKKEDKRRILKMDAFSEQQIEMSQFYELFCRSIDALIGGRVDYNDFTSTMVGAEAAYLIHDGLKDANTFDKPPLVGPRFKDDFEKCDLKPYCASRIASPQLVAKKLKELKDDTKRKLTEQDLEALADEPNVEEFWQQLKKHKLLSDKKQHVFLNDERLSQLNPGLAKMLQTCKPIVAEEANCLSTQSTGSMDRAAPATSHRIWLYELSNQTNWQECDENKISDAFTSETVQLLEAIGALVKSRSASLVEKNDPKSVVFDKFSSISKTQFVHAGISAAEATSILTQLCENKTLINVDNNSTHYVLSNEVDLTVVPACYAQTVVDLFKASFAYVLLYRDLAEKSKNIEPLRLTLPSTRNATAAFIDLMECGVFEFSNVEIVGLDTTRRKDQSLFNRGSNAVKDFAGVDDGKRRNVKHVIGVAQKRCTQIIASTLKEKPNKRDTSFLQWKSRGKLLGQTVGIVPIERSPDMYDALKDMATVNAVCQQLMQAAGIDNYGTLDAKLVETWEEIRRSNLVALRETSLLFTHGATHMIQLHEKGDSIWKLGAVTVGAIIQLAVGGAVLIGTGGIGAFASSFFISEGLCYGASLLAKQLRLKYSGISDLVYVLQGAISGHAGGYWQHKMMSMAASAVLCGAGAWAARGKQFNAVAHGINGSGWTGGGVNFLCLSGRQLMKQAGKSRVFLEALKQIGVRVASSVCNVLVFAALQKVLSHIIENAVKLARCAILELVKKFINNGMAIRQTLAEVLHKLGKDKGRRLALDCGKYVLQGKADCSWLAEASDFILVKYRHLFQNFGYGLAQGKAYGGGGSAGAEQIQAFLQKLKMFIFGAQLLQMLSSIGSRVVTFIGEIDDYIKVQSAAIVTKEEPNNAKTQLTTVEVDKICEELLNEWEERLGATIDESLKQRIAMPLLAFATSFLQQKLETAVRNGYSRFMKHLDKNTLDRSKHEYEEEKASGQYTEQVAWQRYETKLKALMGTTRSPEVIAQIIATGIKIDMTVASACASLVSLMRGSAAVTVRITNERGETFEFSAGTLVVGKPVEVYEFTLNNQHYSADDSSIDKSTGRNTCLFDTLTEKVSGFREMFATDASFRDALGVVICTDPYYRYHIESGWHSIAVQKGHVGGEVLLTTGSPADIEAKIQNKFKDTEAQIKASQQALEALVSGTIKSLQQRMVGDENKDNRETLTLLKAALSETVKNNTPQLGDSREDIDAKQNNVNSSIEKFVTDLEAHVKSYCDNGGRNSAGLNVKGPIDKLRDLGKDLNSAVCYVPSQGLQEQIVTAHTSQLYEIPSFRSNALSEAARLAAAWLPMEEDTDVARQSRKEGRDLHTASVMQIRERPDEIFVSFNYYDKRTGKEVTDEQMRGIVNELRKSAGLDSVNKVVFLGVDRTKLSNEKNFTLPSLDNVTKEKKADALIEGQRMSHRTHGEMINLSYARGAGVPPDQVNISASKQACYKCLLSADRHNVQLDVGPGIQMKVNHFEAPEDIPVIKLGEFNFNPSR